MPDSPEQHQQARLVVRRLSVLGGGAEVLRKACARALAEVSPSDGALLLESIIALARGGLGPAATVLVGFARALELEADAIPHREELRQLAGLLEQPLAESLFVDGQPLLEYNADAAARADAKLVTMPLGHLKTRARLTRNPDELARLAVVSNPTVIREVLKNPRLTEDVVVRIASRRPARPEPLVEIWRSARWSTRQPVRRALVFNPYLPPEVGARILPLLARTDLEFLSSEGGVHVSLKLQARLLLEAT